MSEKKTYVYFLVTVLVIALMFTLTTINSLRGLGYI